jgi:hypothetical protein
MRISTLTLALVIAGFVGISAPAQARALSMHKHSAEELQKICTKVGGRFSQGPKRYGCGTDCNGGTGTDCIVSCDADQKCEAQVIGARRPHTLESALRK